MIYKVSRFSKGPHWDAAIVEASTPDEAKMLLQSTIIAIEPDTVWEWEALPSMDTWHVDPAAGPVYLLLGAGCR